MDILENCFHLVLQANSAWAYVLLGSSAWHFFLLVLLAGPKPKSWIKEGECESDPGTGSSGHL